MARRPGVSQPHLQDIFWSVSPGIGGQGARAAKAPTGPTSGPSSLSLLLTGPGKAVSPDPKDQAWLGGYSSCKAKPQVWPQGGWGEGLAPLFI